MSISGINSSKYFLQDSLLEITPSVTVAAGTLAYANTIRVKVMASPAAGIVTINVGGQSADIDFSQVESNGTTDIRTEFVDLRGANLSDNFVSYSATGDASIVTAYYNLLSHAQAKR